MAQGTPIIHRIQVTPGKINDVEIIALEVPADIKYLSTISSVIETVLERLNKPPRDPQAGFAIKLAVHEACTNVIEHAYHGKPGRIRMEVCIEPSEQEVIINLEDHGDAAVIDPLAQPDLDSPKIKGYGLFLMKSLVDRVDYHREGDTNRWRLIKSLQ